MPSFGPAEVGTGRGVTFSMGAVTLLITSGQKVLFLFRVCSTAVQVCTAQGKQGWQDLPSSHSAGGGRGTQKQVIPWKERQQWKGEGLQRTFALFLCGF